MLDHVHREDLVGGFVLERRELVQVADDVGLLPGARRRDVHVDVAGEDLVAAAQIQFHEWNTANQKRATASGEWRASMKAWPRAMRSTTSRGWRRAQSIPPTISSEMRQKSA